MGEGEGVRKWGKMGKRKKFNKIQRVNARKARKIKVEGIWSKQDRMISDQY